MEGEKGERGRDKDKWVNICTYVHIYINVVCAYI